MYDFVKSISEPLLWFAFFGYGIACSLLIDLFTVKIARRVNKSVKIVLYIVAGYAIFFYKGFSVYTIIAGTVGALCAIIFLIGTDVAKRKPYFKYVFAIVLPLFFIILMQVDFTTQKNWTETKNDASYTANFDYFNGEHAIPIEVREGQTLRFSVQFSNKNEGGQGYHVVNKHDQLVGMSENSDGTMETAIEETGVYSIVVTGDNLAGSFKVNWDVQ